MTKTTKIVLAVSAALLIAMLGAYLWIEYGGSSDDSDQGLTVEEQSPVIHDSGADDSADSSAETEPPDDSEAAQTSEAEQADDNGGAENTAAASPDASASADAPDEFSTQLQEGIQEIVDYAAKMKAQVPEMASFGDTSLASVEGLAELDAQLRRQGTALEARREQLLMKYINNTMDNLGSMTTGAASMALSGGALTPERIMELSQSFESMEPPKKLHTLLRGDMTEEELTQKMMATPEYKAKVEAAMSEMRESLQGLDLEGLNLDDLELPELHEDR